MAVFEIVSWEVKPGRMEEALAALKDTISVCQRIDTGLVSIRVANTVVAGERSGQVVAIFEHTDLGAWGTSIETEENDPEFLAIAKRFGTDSPVSSFSRAILKEIEV
jgi:hypothetical protein